MKQVAKLYESRLATTEKSIAALSGNGGCQYSPEEVTQLRERFSAERQKLQEALLSRAKVDTWQNVDRQQTKAKFYFDLLEANKKWQEVAQQRKVVLLDGNRFGFYDTIHEGKMNDAQLPVWASDFRRIQILLELFFDVAEPGTKFIAIQREATKSRELSSYPKDYFDARKIPLLRAVLDSDSHLLQISFRSYTSTFRKFLNAIEESLYPIVIRSVVVKTPEKKPYMDEQGNVVLVDPHQSEFTLVLEWVEFQILSLLQDDEHLVSEDIHE